MKLPKRLSIKYWSLRSRTSAMIVLPLLCITFLALYNINSAIDRESANLQNRSENLLTMAANSSELALFAGDISSLNTLREAMMHDSQIANVLFFDDKQMLLIEDQESSTAPMSNSGLLDGYNHIEGDYWFFTQAVKLNGSPSTEDQEQFESPQENATLGWVTLVVDLGESRSYKSAVLRNSLLTALLMLSAFLWLATRFSRSVVDPITQLTLAVERFDNQDFSQRVDESSSGELGSLERGINKLAERVDRSQTILKDEVNRATQDLEKKNLDLADAKEAAEAANIAKDDFLARMSHELRTPLTGIMGFTRLLAKTDRLSLRKEYSDMIITSSSVLLSTINDILDFSKLKANSFSLKPVQFNLEDSLRDVMDLHRVAAFEKAIELNVLIDSDVPIEVLCDLDKLQKVVNNLLANAVKFTATGDIVMLVSLAKQERNEALIVVSVKDSGIGISPKNMKYLFDPFYQSDASNTRRHDGTGLGLAIAEDFVALLGGDISLDSEEGEGTEVEFTFRARTVIDAPLRQLKQDAFRAVLFDNNPWTRRSWRNQLLKYSDELSAPSHREDLMSTLGPDTQVLLLGFNHYDSSLQQADETLERIRAEYSGTIIAAVADDGSAAFDSLAERHESLLIINKPLTNNRLLSALQEAGVTSMPDLQQSAATHTQDKSARSNGNKTLAGLKLLVAEDNKFNQTLLARLLEAGGATVTLASDGLQALQYAEQQRFDTMVVDLHMPGLNGIQLSSAVRAKPLNASTPILLLTADVLSQQEPEIMASGVNAISYKPIDEDDLIEKICALADSTPRFTTDFSERPKRALITYSKEELSTELARLLNDLKRSLETRDFESLADQAHQLAGVVGLSGLEDAQVSTQNLNAAAKTRDAGQAEAHLARLTRDLDG